MNHIDLAPRYAGTLMGMNIVQIITICIYISFSRIIYFCYKYSQMHICKWILCILGRRVTKSN